MLARCKHLKAQLEEDHFQLSSEAVGGAFRRSLAVKLRASASCWLSATLSSLPCGILHRASQHGSWLPQRQQVRDDERVQERQESQSYNLTLDMTVHHLCHILFVRIESLGPGHMPEEGLDKGGNLRRRGSWGLSERLPTTETRGLWCERGQWDQMPAETPRGAGGWAEPESWSWRTDSGLSK